MTIISFNNIIIKILKNVNKLNSNSITDKDEPNNIQKIMKWVSEHKNGFKNLLGLLDF